MRTGPGRDLANRSASRDRIAASQLAGPGVNARLQIKDIRHPVDRRVDSLGPRCRNHDPEQIAIISDHRRAAIAGCRREVRPPRVVERTAADHGVGIDPRDPPTRPSPPRARAADTSVKELRRCSAQRAAEITRAVRPSVTGRAMDYRSGESSAAHSQPAPSGSPSSHLPGLPFVCPAPRGRTFVVRASSPATDVPFISNQTRKCHHRRSAYLSKRRTA